MGNRAHVTLAPRILVTSTLASPGANADAVITLPAEPGFHRTIQAVLWSYNDIPSTGGLAITDDGVGQLDLDITAAGPGMLPLNWVFGAESDIVVTLDAGGPGVTGRLTVRHFLTRR